MAGTTPCTAQLCSHPRAEKWGWPRPGDHPANGRHQALLLHSCFSLTPLPFTARKCFQKINTGTAGGPFCTGQCHCRVSSCFQLMSKLLGLALRLFGRPDNKHLPEVADQADVVFQSTRRSSLEPLQSWHQLTWISVRLSEPSSNHLLLAHLSNCINTSLHSQHTKT